MKKPERRFDGSFLVSIALHIVVGAALVLVLSIPNPIRQWLTMNHSEPPKAEHITYIAAPSAACAEKRARVRLSRQRSSQPPFLRRR